MLVLSVNILLQKLVCGSLWYLRLFTPQYCFYYFVKFKSHNFKERKSEFQVIKPGPTVYD